MQIKINHNSLDLEKTIQEIEEKVIAKHESIVLCFQNSKTIDFKLIDDLIAILIERNGVNWFINSNIMIDADDEKKANKIRDRVGDFLFEAYKQINNDEEEGNPINMDDWKSIPCIKGRLADAKDVEAGLAGFYLNIHGDGLEARPIPLDLPLCAILHAEEDVPVIIIQAEEIISEGQMIVGFIDVKTSKRGIAQLKELTILNEPNDSFQV